MEQLSKGSFLSYKQQKFIKELAESGYQLIVFKAQKTFKNRNSFNGAMKILKNKGVIKPDVVFHESKAVICYGLTNRGIKLYEEILCQ